MLKANIENWSVVLYPQIYGSTDTPQNVYARIDCGKQIALFGRAKDDPRYDPITGAFKDGNRIVTSTIKKVENGLFHTEDTIYNPGKINDDFLAWCKEVDYSVYECKNYDLYSQKISENEKSEPITLRHICETCGKDEILTSEEAFEQGWDYPPRMGVYGVVSPRTCGDCSINTTLWWAMAGNKTSPEELGERHQATMQRILSEPESIMPESPVNKNSHEET